MTNASKLAAGAAVLAGLTAAVICLIRHRTKADRPSV